MPFVNGCIAANAEAERRPDIPISGPSCPPPPCTLTILSLTEPIIKPRGINPDLPINSSNPVDPSFRTRTRIAVTEIVEITAAGAQGNVSWTISSSSNSNFFTGNEPDDTNQSKTASGNVVKLFAAELPESMEVIARDSVCEQRITFTVDCCYLVTPKKIKAIFGGRHPEHFNEGLALDIAQAFNSAYDVFSVDTCLRKAHFFAQCKTEASGGTPSYEGLSYSSDVLLAKWDRFVSDDSPHNGTLYPIPPRTSHEAYELDPIHYVRASEFAYHSERIGNQAYSWKNGNKGPLSGDGYNYRGAGYIQITGRDTYKSAQDLINRLLHLHLDFADHPERVAHNVYEGLLSALSYWLCHHLYDGDHAAGGDSDEDVNHVSRGINPGLFSRQHIPPTRRDLDHLRGIRARQSNFHSAKVVFKTDDCPNKPVSTPVSSPSPTPAIPS